MNCDPAARDHDAGRKLRFASAVARAPRGEPEPARPSAAAAPAATTCTECGQAAGLPVFLEREEAGAAPPSSGAVVVGAADDPMERDADRAAAAVLSAPARRVAVGAASWRAPAPEVRRAGEGRAARASGATDALPATGAALATSGGGRGLDARARAYFEPRFGLDLARVRVHTDGLAAEAASELRARAFTYGEDVFFAAGRFRPERPEGRRLLAHELAHVAQHAVATTVPRFVRRQGEGATATAREAPPAADRDAARDYARRVYESLANVEAEPGVLDYMLGTAASSMAAASAAAQPALDALRDHDVAMRVAIQDEFFAQYHTSIQQFLHDHTTGDDRVNAFALLRAESEWGDAAFMARALLADGVRDEEPLRILYALPGAAARRELAHEFYATFGIWLGPGSGTLVEAIRDRLDGWRQQKCLVLLARDRLTEADEVYFDSVGISGAHEQAVVERVERVWRQGAAAFQQLRDDWDEGLRRAHPPWMPTAFTADPFLVAMAKELDDEWWQIVLDLYDADMRRRSAETDITIEGLHAAPGATPDVEGQTARREQVQLDLYENIFRHALAEENRDQVLYAAGELRRIHETRIARARRLGDERVLRDYERARDTQIAAVMSAVPGAYEVGSNDYNRVWLATLGPTLVDEIWLAFRDSDETRVLQLITRAWAEESIATLADEALRPRTAERDGRQVEVRPAYNIHGLLPVTRGDWRERADALLRGGDLVERGAHRLATEVGGGDSDANCRQIYEFLTTPGLAADLRLATVIAYTDTYLGEGETSAAPEAPAGAERTAGSVLRRFVRFILDHYERSHASFQIQDLLLPARTASDMADRAEERLASESRTLGQQVVTGWTIIGDAFTGNDTTQVAYESAAQLRYLAVTGHGGGAARPGATGDDQLATRSWQLFQQRFQDFAAARAAVTEALAAIAEIAVSIAITAATGGAAAGLMAAAIASTVAGIAVHEMALGSNYDTLSEENARRLMLAAGTAVLGAAANEVTQAAVNINRLSRLGAFGVRAAQEAVVQTGAQGMQLLMQDRLPSDGDVLGALMTIGGSALGAGVGGAIAHAPGAPGGAAPELADSVGQARRTIISHAASSLVGGWGGEVGTMVAHDEDLSVGEIAQRLAARGARDIATGIVTGLNDVYVQRRQLAGAGEPEEDPHAPPRRPPGAEDVIDPATGRPRRSTVELSEADHRLLQHGRKPNERMSGEELEAELDVVEGMPRRRSTDPNYEEEVDALNGHVWRRTRQGYWCRYSNGGTCMIDRRLTEWRGLTREERDELQGMIRRGHVTFDDLEELARYRNSDVDIDDLLFLCRSMSSADLARLADVLHANGIPLTGEIVDRIAIALEQGQPPRAVIDQVHVRVGLHADTEMGGPDEDMPTATGAARGVGVRRSSEALGRQGGEQFCAERGITLHEQLDPRAATPGHGFDATGERGDFRYILEWKGETSELRRASARSGRGAQMSDEWVGWELAEMAALGVDVQPFLVALDQNQLLGYAVRTRTWSDGSIHTRAVAPYDGYVYSIARVRAAFRERSRQLTNPAGPARSRAEIGDELLNPTWLDEEGNRRARAGAP